MSAPKQQIVGSGQRAREAARKAAAKRQQRFEADLAAILSQAEVEKTTNYLLRLPSDLDREIEIRLAGTGRTKKDLMIAAIREYLEKQGERQ